MHLSVAFLRALHTVLRDLGLPEEALSSLLHSDPHAVLPWEEAKARIGAALVYSDEPALGLYIGQRISVPALHVVGHLLLTAKTLREAAAQYTRFAPLIWAGASYTLSEEGDEASYTFAPQTPDEGDELFCTELTMPAIVNVMGALRVSGEPPSRVEFRYQAPSYRDEYESVLGCPVLFGRARTRVVMPRAILDETRRLPDEQLKQLLYERAERLLEQGGRGADIVLRVRDVLRSRALEGFELSAAARELKMTPSSLRRRLSERGTAFSDLLDDVRREVACEALGSEMYDIKALSSRLGFSEPSAFHRAFRRWTGTTPAQFRAAYSTRSTIFAKHVAQHQAKRGAV